jgi:hypothetical protein
MALTQTTAASVSVTLSTFISPNFFGTTPVTVASGETVLFVRVVGVIDPPTAMTFNSVALTRILSATDGNARSVSMWELVNPSVGTFDLRLQRGANVTYRVLVTTLNGNGDTVVRGTSATRPTNFTTTPTATVTTDVGDLVFDVGNIFSVPTVGAGQTEQMNVLDVNYSVGSIETATSTSTPMSWTATPADRNQLIAVPYRVSAAGGSAIAAISSGYHTRNINR